MTRRIKSIDEVPHDPVYVEAYGANYRTHPDFVSKMNEAIEGTRDLGNVRSDIGEAVAQRKRRTAYTQPGW